MTFAGDRIKLHGEQFFWYLPPHIMRVRWAGHVACVVMKRYAYRVSVEET
jgi:hypothetical protein